MELNLPKGTRIIKTTLERLQSVLASLPNVDSKYSNYFLPGWALDKPKNHSFKEGGFLDYDPGNIPDHLEFRYESSYWACVNVILIIGPDGE